MSAKFPELMLPCKRCGVPICLSNFMCHACGTEMLIDWPKAKVTFQDGRTSTELGRNQILDAILLTMILREKEAKGKEVVVKPPSGQERKERNCCICIDGRLVAFVQFLGVYIIAAFPEAGGRSAVVSVDVRPELGKATSYALRRYVYDDAAVVEIWEQFRCGEDALLMQDSFLYSVVQQMFS